MDNDSQRDLGAMSGQSFTGDLQHILHKDMKASVEHYFSPTNFPVLLEIKRKTVMILNEMTMASISFEWPFTR